MTALSIRNMNFTLARREQDGSMAHASHERSHYWFIERKSKVKRGEWVYVRDLMASKSEAAETWNTHYRFSKLGKFRLVHKMTY